MMSMSNGFFFFFVTDVIKVLDIISRFDSIMIMILQIFRVMKSIPFCVINYYRHNMVHQIRCIQMSFTLPNFPRMFASLI